MPESDPITKLLVTIVVAHEALTKFLTGERFDPKSPFPSPVSTTCEESRINRLEALDAATGFLDDAIDAANDIAREDAEPWLRDTQLLLSSLVRGLEAIETSSDYTQQDEFDGLLAQVAAIYRVQAPALLKATGELEVFAELGGRLAPMVEAFNSGAGGDMDSGAGQPPISAEDLQQLGWRLEDDGLRVEVKCSTSRAMHMFPNGQDGTLTKQEKLLMLMLEGKKTKSVLELLSKLYTENELRGEEKEKTMPERIRSIVNQINNKLGVALLTFRTSKKYLRKTSVTLNAPVIVDLEARKEDSNSDSGTFASRDTD